MRSPVETRPTAASSTFSTTPSTRLKDATRDTKPIEAALGLKLSVLAGYAPQLDACLGCGTDLDEAENPLHFAPEHGGVLCAGCRSQTGDAFPLAPGTLESVRTLIETPVREAPLQAGPRENVLRVVRSHVLAHAPGNTLVGRGLTGARRPA